MGKKEIKVSVLILTYNQQDYIAQAIESVLIQQTDYSYEIIIGDDGSTDNTRQICLEYKNKYPSIITLLFHEKNIGLLANFVSIVQAAKGKYIASCDGDDYWIDSFKIQKQVDFLENNQDYAFIHTGKKMLYNGAIVEDKKNGYKQTMEELLMCCFICSSTVVFRKDLANNFIKDFVEISLLRGWKMEDYPVWLFLGIHYKFAYMEDDTLMYRVLPNTLSRLTKRDKAYQFDRSVINVRKYFFLIYESKNKLDKSFINSFKEMVFHARKRMLLDYGWLACEQIGQLLATNPLFYVYLLKSKIMRLRK